MTTLHVVQQVAPARADAAADSKPDGAKLGLSDLKSLTAREIDERLHALGLSRKAAGWLTAMVIKSRAEAAPSTKPAACNNGAISIVLNRCSACPHGDR